MSAVPKSDLPDDLSRNVPANDLPSAPTARDPQIGGVSPRAQALRETIVGTGKPTKAAFEDQDAIEKRLRAAGKTDAEIENDPEWQASAKSLSRAVSSNESSMAIGNVVAPAAVSLGAKAAKPAGNILSRLIPGATGRAKAALAKIAPSLDKDAIGQDVLKNLLPNYDALHATRAAQLAKVANTMEEGPAKTAAFREVYQDPRFAALKKIEENPLGKKVTDTTTQYSSVPKVNPHNFVKQAFKTPKDVRDLRELYNGDQTAVEQVASKYVVSELKRVMAPAEAAAKTEMDPLKGKSGRLAAALQEWRHSPAADFLKEVPATKQVTDDFIDSVTKVAQTQKAAKITAVSGLTLGLWTEGEHAWSFIKGLLGGVE
jgi:hypothetical protein